MKRAVKKEASSERQRMIKTGGGRLTPPLPPPPGEDNDTSDWLRSIMSTSIDGNEAVYDDDVMPPNLTQTVTQLTDQKVIFKAIAGDGDENSNPIENIQIKLVESEENIEKSPSRCITFDTSTQHSSLRRPMSSPLKRLAKKKKVSDSCNLMKRVLREKKMSVLDGLHNLEFEKIRDSIMQEKEMHDLKIKNIKDFSPNGNAKIRVRSSGIEE